MNPNYLNLKFLALGDSGVGKTSILNQYVDGVCDAKLAPTVGIDIRDKDIVYESTKSHSPKTWKIHLQLWDTAGQERFRSITTSFFRDAIGFLLVFDLTNETSFISTRNWITELQGATYTQDHNLILLGNKCDLDDKRIISKKRASKFAEELQVDYIETSAKENLNIKESIDLLLDKIMKRLEKNEQLIKPNPLSELPIKLGQETPGKRDEKPSLNSNKNTYWCCYQ